MIIVLIFYLVKQTKVCSTHFCEVGLLSDTIERICGVRRPRLTHIDYSGSGTGHCAACGCSAPT